MSETTTVDARGLSCPQPVLLTRQAISGLAEGVVEVLVDSGTSRDNVSRCAQTAGWTVTVQDAPGGDYRLVLRK
ncbi:MAG TPA: sulfurtransferase TusA family protein [Candidatus Anammoximicrobium sp.]|nr:sulfurtransferase TusA family protein [Candidatus Anammoximicrobium sp.]